MRNVWTIAQRELKSYFSSPVAYGLMAFFALITGYFFYAAVYFFMRAQLMGRGQPMDVNEYVVWPILSNVSVINLFIIPMIAMRLFAEEKRSGTIELLVTSPVKDIEIVLGKWLAAVILYLSIISISLVDMLLLYVGGHPDWKPMLIGYLGLALQGAALLAIGTFISSTTRNQIIAGAGTFAACLMLWTVDWIASSETSAFAKAIGYLSVISHFEPFARGVLDTKDVIYYVTLTILGLFLTSRSLESLRWRS